MKKKFFYLIPLFLFGLLYFNLPSVLPSDAKNVEAIKNQIEIPRKGSFIQVYYFHGKFRCPSCKTIENYTRETVENNFLDLHKNKTINFIDLDYQAPENKHFIEQFQLSMPTVIVVKYQNGEIKKWENLEQVWALMRTKEYFTDYVKNSISDIIKG